MNYWRRIRKLHIAAENFVIVALIAKYPVSCEDFEDIEIIPLDSTVALGAWCAFQSALKKSNRLKELGGNHLWERRLSCGYNRDSREVAVDRRNLIRR
jgi:hypothetical protein